MASCDDRETLVFLAKLAEEADRYDDVVDAMKKLAKLNIEFTEEERSILSSSYKKVVEARRLSLGMLSLMDNKEEDIKNMNCTNEYCRKIELEITDICNEVISLIDEHLMPYSLNNTEAMVLYNKMKGDYNRYLAEIKTGDEKEEAAKQSLKAYEAGTVAAKQANMAPTHPLRLSLALNWSVLYHEIMKCPEKACLMAELSYNEALSQLPTLTSNKNNSYEETTWIMGLLKENLTLWTTNEFSEDEIIPVIDAR